jgi:hypothetical protein
MSEIHGLSLKVLLPQLIVTLAGRAGSFSTMLLITMSFTTFFRKRNLCSMPFMVSLTDGCCALFSQIPFYHTEKATNAIIPLLGSQYHQEKDSSFLKDLWKTFIECQWVQPEEGGPDGELKFQKGPSPSAKHMIRKLQGVI